MKMLLSIVVACANLYLPVCSAETVTYSELARSALLMSPEAASIDATLAERAAQAFSVKVMENPVLSIGAEIPVEKPPEGGREDTGTSFTISQAIRPSDFGVRTALSAVIQQAADIEKIIALNDFFQSLSVTYAQAWRYQETEVILQEAYGRVQKILTKISDGAHKGLFPEGDLELFKSELKTFEAERVAARAEFSRSLAELTRLSGMALSGLSFARPSDALPMQREELIKAVRESKLPIQRRVELLRNISVKQLELARVDSVPAIAPQLGFAHHDDGTNQAVLGVSIPLPFFDRNQGDRIQAHGAVAAAERAQGYATSEGLVAECLLLFDVVEKTAEQVAIYESGVVPSRRKAVAAYHRQFEAGVGTAFQLWQSQRELNQSQLRTLELRMTLAATRAKINALLGNQEF